MKPETVQALLANVPELKELIAFLSFEAAKLNTLDGEGYSTDVSADIIALDVKARLKAKQTIDAMLAPLLSSVDKPVGVDPSEFVV